MNVTTHLIEKVSAYVDYISHEMVEKEWIFRGHENDKFSLKPSIARIEDHDRS